MTPAGTPPDLDRYCGATTRSGTGCRRPAGWGTQHPGAGRCKLHGGATPTHQRSAARLLEEREARTLLRRLERPEPLGDLTDELLAFGAEQRAWLAVCRERVAELSCLTTTDRLGVEREGAVVALYERSGDRTGRFLLDLAKLGLEARTVALNEQRAQQIVDLFSAAVERAAIPQEYRPALSAALAAELRSAG